MGGDTATTQQKLNTSHVAVSFLSTGTANRNELIKDTPLWARRRERKKERKGMNEGLVDRGCQGSDEPEGMPEGPVEGGWEGQ
jgi:hypothetical protein